ncbi:MAG: ATP-dependent Clp protease proteolytic subunit [Stellaceae bacterium]
MTDAPSLPPPIVYATFAGGINQDTLNRIFLNLSAATQRGVTTIHLLFESTGGNVGDGISLFNYFDSFPLKLHIYNTGTVASVAVTSFLGAPHRYASAHATFMIHRSRFNFLAPGQAAQLLAIASSLQADDARTEAIIRSRTVIPEDRWAAQTINDVTITAQEALNFGLVHEIREFRPPAGNQIFNI